MNTPPLLLGLGLLFWGWQTGLLLLAVPAALIIEAPRLIRRRFELSNKDFNRTADLSAFLAMALLAWSYLTKSGPSAQWMPLAFLPLVLAQACSTRQAVSLTAIFYTVRTRHPDDSRGMDVSYYYLALLVISASAANQRTPWFFAGLLVLVAYGLWPFRARGAPPTIWALLLVATALAGWIGQIQLHSLHMWVEQKAINWYQGYLEEGRNPYQHTTAIGQIGQLKQSDRILLRMEASRPPRLLQQAVYNRYQFGTWMAFKPEFEAVPVGRGGDTWVLREGVPPARKLVLYSRLENGMGVLALPPGTFRIDNLPVLNMEKNRFGVVKVGDGPPRVKYEVAFDPRSPAMGPPDEYDLLIPDEERPVLEQIAAGLGCPTNGEAVKAVARYFDSGFTYSLDLNAPLNAMTAISDFLTRSHSGHCEYFAAATVLLLRALHVPARYATGFRVAEFSALERRWVIRSRHAHAWALAWSGGTWRALDTTPPVWLDKEAGATSSWRIFRDLLSWLNFNLSQFRDRERNLGPARHLLWLVLPGLLFLLHRLRKRGTVAARPVHSSKAADGPPRLGLDSPFFRIEEALTPAGLSRRPGETAQAWVARLGALGNGLQTDKLNRLLELHQRLRFDPRGLPHEEREALERGVGEWLREYGEHHRR